MHGPSPPQILEGPSPPSSPLSLRLCFPVSQVHFFIGRGQTRWRFRHWSGCVYVGLFVCPFTAPLILFSAACRILFTSYSACSQAIMHRPTHGLHVGLCNGTVAGGSCGPSWEGTPSIFLI